MIIIEYLWKFIKGLFYCIARPIIWLLTARDCARCKHFRFLEYDNANRYDGSYEEYREYKYNKELHYDHNKKKWVKREEYTGTWFPATFPCHSYKAAKRHLRKHNEIPVGTKFRLVSEFVGFDRFLTKK